MSVFKSLVNLAATAGVAGVIAVSPIFTPKAEALTETQALERLARIPVFTITDDKGVPLTASIPPQPHEACSKLAAVPQTQQLTNQALAH